MTNFLHWRKMTWVLVLWSGSLLAWMVVAGSGLAILTLGWLGGVVLLGVLWLATQPLFHQGRGFEGVFVRPSWTQWRVVDLHRTYATRPPRRHVG
jgi:hypothetical protein